MKKRYILLFLGGSLLSSCSHTKALVDPYALAPSLPNAMWQIDAEDSCLLSSKYFTTYIPKDYDDHDLSLAELIDIALYNNPNTKSSWAEARSKAAIYAQSEAAYLPKIDASAKYQRERQTFSLSETFTIPYLLTTTGPEMQITYTLLDFGARKASSDAARKSLLFADLTHNRTIQTAIQIVMDDYYTYLYEKERLLALEADVENASVTLQAAEEKGRVGVFAAGDISQAKTHFIQKKIAMIGQKKATLRQFSQLAKDLGLPANISFNVQPLPKKVVVKSCIEDADLLIAKAQKCRPDLQASIAKVAEKKADLVKARSGHFPKVDASFDLGKYWYDHAQDEDYHWAFLLKLELPLFEGFMVENQIKQKQADLEKSAAELLSKELSVVSEIQNARTNLIAAKDALGFTEEYLKEAKKQFRIATENYRLGVNTILDVLSAQSSLADARAKLAEAKKNWYQSLAEIAYSTGAFGFTEEVL